METAFDYLAFLVARDSNVGTLSDLDDMVS